MDPTSRDRSLASFGSEVPNTRWPGQHEKNRLKGASEVRNRLPKANWKGKIWVCLLWRYPRVWLGCKGNQKEITYLFGGGGFLNFETTPYKCRILMPLDSQNKQLFGPGQCKAKKRRPGFLLQRKGPLQKESTKCLHIQFTFKEFLARDLGFRSLPHFLRCLALPDKAWPH